MMWRDPNRYEGGAHPVSVGPGPTPPAEPDSGLAIRAADGRFAGGGVESPHSGSASLGLRFPQLASVEATPDSDHRHGRLRHSHDPHAGGSRLALGEPSALFSPDLTTAPRGCAIPGGGDAASDTLNGPRGGRPSDTNDDPGGGRPCQSQANRPTSLFSERSTVSATKSDRDAAREDGPQHRLLDRRRISVRDRTRLRHIRWRRQPELDLESW